MNCEANQIDGLRIDDELELGRLLDAFRKSPLNEDVPSLKVTKFTQPSMESLVARISHRTGHLESKARWTSLPAWPSSEAPVQIDIVHVSQYSVTHALGPFLSSYRFARYPR